jgi:hypothetical protein
MSLQAIIAGVLQTGNGPVRAARENRTLIFNDHFQILL